MSDKQHDIHEEHEEHHVSYGTYTMIWLALVALTALTVAVASINLGNFTFFVAMLIASIKAMLVINIFMHVKYDDLLMKGIVIACGFILLIIAVFYSTDIIATWGL